MNANIGILLAAGESSRFNAAIPKQLYVINGKSMVSHSIDIMSETLDELIIITNNVCYNQILNIIAEKPNANVLVNNVNCRLESIKVALDYISKRNCTNIIIHDSARPFITQNHIQELLTSIQTHQYAQYYLKLVNGLARKKEGGYEVVNREEFIELCTPQIVNYYLFDFVFRNYIETKKACEIIELVDILKINYNLIEGCHKHLKKITTLYDL